MVIDSLYNILEYKLLEIDKYSITVYHLLIIALIIIVTRFLVNMIKRLLVRAIKKRNLERGRTMAVYQIVKYLIWILALIIMLESVGIDLTLLLAGSAALLVGIGFGLQTIFSDVFAGLFMLFEGNLKVNDVVSVGDLVGRVEKIGLRTTVIHTRDDISMVVPNNKFISEKVINWSHMDLNTRFHVNVGVAYGSDVRLVEKCLLECAEAEAEISKYPKPFVRFNDFGESSLDFQLYFWTMNTFEVENLKSRLRFRIDAIFRQREITIPFPQQDVYIKQHSKNSSKEGQTS